MEYLGIAVSMVECWQRRTVMKLVTHQHELTSVRQRYDCRLVIIVMMMMMMMMMVVTLTGDC